ncbi:MAG: hypothetical protein IKK33_16300 [Lachnospiraceae bacterium]|nr:hypothetical protein [Lachnospiraceae bacterium]
MKKRQGGYLTIYVALSLTAMLSLCLTIIEGARENSIRWEAECIMDVGMNSVLAEYHRELLNQYNLFYIDSSYGSAYPSYYNTEARLKYYLEQNLNLEDVSYVDFIYKDLLELQLADVWLKEVTLATDFGGKLFQKRAAEAIWDDSGMQTLENVLDWVKTIDDNELLERDIEDEKEKIDEQLDEYYETKGGLENNQWIEVEIEKPTEHLDEMRAKGVLTWVLEEGTIISGQQVDLSQYITARRKRGDINLGNPIQMIEITPLESVLFHEYIIRYSGHYGKTKKGSLLQYQTEYVIAGKEKDEDNLKSVAMTISGLREVANVIYLNKCSAKMDMIKILAKVAAYAIFTPEAEELFKASIVMGWAYLESVYDTKVLLAGGKVPLMKEDEDWHYDLDSILTTADMEVKKQHKKGLSYEDYLRILLYLENQEKITFRFMDLMEMDIRLTKGNEAFRMDSCIESIGVQAVIKSGYGYEYVIERRKKYE